MGFVGDTVPPRLEQVFSAVAAARDAAIDFVSQAFATGQADSGLGGR